MSTLRSPQGNKTPVGPGGSHSQPDLSKPLYEYDADNLTNMRKRKQQNCDCECGQVMSSLASFRADILSVLETNLKPVRDDISAMKHQIDDIKSSTEKLLTEHNNMKIEISQLQKTSSDTEAKMSSIETEIEKLKSTFPTQSTSQILSNEAIISEMQERERRSKNIIVVGIPEPTNADDHVRNAEEIQSIQKIFLNANPQIVKVMRIGKLFTGKVRPLKVILGSSQEVKEIMRNKNKLPENVRVYHDKTPTEIKVLKELSQELDRRTKNGEKDLIIKYIKGTPKIIKATKN